MADTTAVVVGGGISGIVSAMLLKETFDRVYLIEREEQLGGLLNSFVNESGVAFDYGTHFLQETGIPALDGMVFGRITPDEWHILDFLKAGNYFRGHVHQRSPYLDLRSLPEDLYHKGMVECLSIHAHDVPPTNLEEHCERSFGPTLTRHVVAPLMKKFTGCPLSHLSPDAHVFFGLERVIGLTPFASRELKRSERFDRTLAFHHYAERTSHRRYYYPKHGGIGQWIRHLSDELSQRRVEVVTGQSVKQIHHRNHRVTSVSLGNGRSIDCDDLVWTVPVAHCLQASGVNLRVEPPPRRVTTLYHFVIDQPFQTDLEYMHCYDESLATFRVTLYANVGDKRARDPAQSATVEVLSDGVSDVERMLEVVYQELCTMGLVAPSANIVYRKALQVQAGFPVLTPRFVEQSQSQLQVAKQTLHNAAFLGKASGSCFFMHDVLAQTYHALISPDRNRIEGPLEPRREGREAHPASAFSRERTL